MTQNISGKILPLVSAYRRVQRFVRTQLIVSIIGVLIVSWLVVSWIVYRLEAGAPDATIDSYGKGLWWGVVTFLTIGYGDYTPVTLGGRIWAGFLMFVGVFGIAIITSKISSYFLEQMLREGRGLVDSSRLKDHFIVCGWKEDMHELLTHILDFNAGLTSADLVLIANLNQTVIDAIREHPRLKGLQVIIGNPYEAVILGRAAPERARKVLILADRTPNPNGMIPTMTEVDARTIMIAMTLANIARGTLVAAEILDPKMDQYLKLASVGEIIYSREYSRLLLGNASGGTGIANIIFDLLDPKTPTLISTKPVPEHFTGMSYPEFKAAFERNQPQCAVIGVLENTGNLHRIKELALRQAQRTPDMDRLLQNLRSVKELRCNHPVFNPGAEYIIPEGAMAIAIETRAENQMSHVEKQRRDTISV